MPKRDRKPRRWFPPWSPEVQQLWRLLLAENVQLPDSLSISERETAVGSFVHHDEEAGDGERWYNVLESSISILGEREVLPLWIKFWREPLLTSDLQLAAIQLKLIELTGGLRRTHYTPRRLRLIHLRGWNECKERLERERVLRAAAQAESGHAAMAGPGGSITETWESG